jgi:TRAP-type C4-dicarboxylate transport system permease small subunit
VSLARPLRFLSIVERAAWIASRALALAGLGVLLAFAVATLLDGLLRHLINQPIEFVRDSGGLVVAVSVVACFPLAMLSRSNISIKFIDLAIPDWGARLLNAIASFLVWLTFLVMAIEFLWFARDLDRSNDVTVMLNIAKAPFWYVADVMLWVTVAAQTLIVITDIARCFTGEGSEPPHDLIALDEPV